MAEVEELIRLQTEKLRLLEAYRKQQSGRGSSFQQCAAPPPLQGSLFSHPTSTGAPVAEDYLVRVGVVPATRSLATDKKTEEEEGAEEEEEGVLTAAKLLTFQRVRDKTAPRSSSSSSSKAMGVLAVAREGARGRVWLAFYDLQGQLLATYAPGHDAAITSLAFEAGGASDDALLVTGARDGSMRLHMLTLWKDGKMVAGRRPTTSSFASPFLFPPSATTEAGYGLHVQLETSLSTARDGDDTRAPEPPVLSALLYQHRTFGWTVVSGDAQGTLKCHLRNGTLVKVRLLDHIFQPFLKETHFVFPCPFPDTLGNFHR